MLAIELKKQLDELLEQSLKLEIKTLQDEKRMDIIENILINNKDLISYNQYIKACKILGYYYGCSYNYYKSQEWLTIVPVENNNISFRIFEKTIFPIIVNNQDDEINIIKNLKINLDILLDIKNPSILNPLFLNNGFWYGYLDNNPKEIYEKYAKLQINVGNMTKQFGNDITNHNIEKKSKTIKLGIISSALNPLSDNIHSSSISDSFYPTFLALPKDKFNVVFIYCDKSNKNSNYDDNNLYIPHINNASFYDIFDIQKKIVELNLDILLFLDLHIYTPLNWIALNKLAKIQICTHGHPVT